MADFTCVHCGSDNIQIVRGIFEAGTEVEQTQNNTSVTFFPQIDEDANSDLFFFANAFINNSTNTVKIKTQSTLSKRLGNLNLKTIEQGKMNTLKIQQKYAQKRWKNIVYYIPFLTEIVFGFFGIIALLNSQIIGFLFLGITIFLEYYRKNISRQKKLKIKDLIAKLKQLHSEEKEEIQSEYKKRDKLIQKIQFENTKKLEIWSNLYYCHRCDNVMDLEEKLFTKPDAINNLVKEIYDLSYN